MVHTRALVEFVVLVAVCLTAYFVIIPAQVSRNVAMGLNPDFMPRACVIAILVLAVIGLFSKSLGLHVTASWFQGVVVFAATVAGVAAIYFLGFAIGLVVLSISVTLSLREFGIRRNLMHLAGALVLVAFLYMLGF